MLNDAIHFLMDKSFYELLYFFWYAVVFDLTRYVLMDIVILFYMLKKWEDRKDKLQARNKLFHENPLVSVIAPGKNEGKHIPKLSAWLKRQTYKNLEIIIVDDGSDDDTPEICRRLLKQGAIDKFFRNDIRGGKASAANLALRYTQGEYIVHLDADSHLRDDSIEQIITPFHMDAKIAGVGGDIRVRNQGDSIASSLQAIEYIKSISTGRIITSTLGILRIISGAYGAFRREVLEQLKGWDVGPGLDGDITVKIKKMGLKVVHEPEAICYTNVPSSFKKLAKQRFRWDRSLIRFRLRKHLDLLSLSNKNFTIQKFLMAFDNIFYNLILNFKWWIYFIQMVFFNTDVLHLVLLINYLFYLCANFIELLVACFLFRNTIGKKEYLLFLYVPLMPIYHGLYMRLVRTYAQLMELFHKISYEDAWNPWKVSKIAKKHKI